MSERNKRRHRDQVSQITHFDALSMDQTLWRISREDVVRDMLKNAENEPDDSWPDPIDDDSILLWLHDNAANIEGWVCIEVNKPFLIDPIWVQEADFDKFPLPSEQVQKDHQ